jgi:hypothetical protein
MTTDGRSPASRLRWQQGHPPEKRHKSNLTTAARPTVSENLKTGRVRRQCGHDQSFFAKCRFTACLTLTRLRGDIQRFLDSRPPPDRSSVNAIKVKHEGRKPEMQTFGMAAILLSASIYGSRLLSRCHAPHVIRDLTSHQAIRSKEILDKDAEFSPLLPGIGVRAIAINIVIVCYRRAEQSDCAVGLTGLN